MADITYFVISSDDCKYEGMTKEQIVAAIAEATGNAPTSIDDAFISKIKEINASGTVQIWNGTEAQFNALSPAPAVNKSAIRVGTNGILYICTDDTTLESVAAHASSHGTGGSDPITPASIGAMGIGTDNGAVGTKYTVTVEPDTADNAASIIRIKENATGNTRVLIAANTAENNNEVSQIVLRDGTNVGKVNIQCNTIGAKGIRITDDNNVERIKLHYTTTDDMCLFEIKDENGNDVTLETIGAQERFLCGRNKTIATSAWASDTTYADYPYRASVALPPITAVSFAEIVFSPADATSGNFAPVCDTYNGGIYVYAKAVPDAAITIPTIIVWR